MFIRPFTSIKVYAYPTLYRWMMGNLQDFQPENHLSRGSSTGKQRVIKKIKDQHRGVLHLLTYTEFQMESFLCCHVAIIVRKLH
ncbi:hypothetical protein SLEP1_g43013 [Rubroshorea leprosula]|uniref:Uncharacterized protein n=1 Tax=Rubroshorea leprosula TaxID=152421 RepID=A0AAV5LBN5_9ROSI|nr:hypothetical protein SLEP1_g43013 [Rubroshorea leprosula]